MRDYMWWIAVGAVLGFFAIRGGARSRRLRGLTQLAINGDAAAIARINATTWKGGGAYDVEKLQEYLLLRRTLVTDIGTWAASLSEADPQALWLAYSAVKGALGRYVYLPRTIKHDLAHEVGLTMADCQHRTQSRLDEQVRTLADSDQLTAAEFAQLRALRAELGDKWSTLKFTDLANWNQLVASHIATPVYGDFDWPESLFVEVHPRQMAVMAIRTEDVVIAKMLLAYLDHQRVVYGRDPRMALGSQFIYDLAWMIDRVTERQALGANNETESA